MARLELPSDQTGIQMMALYNIVHQRSALSVDEEQLPKYRYTPCLADRSQDNLGKQNDLRCWFEPKCHTGLQEHA